MGKCTVVARKELLYAWPFGLSAWLAGVVFIDRSKGRVAHLQLNEAAQLVTNKQVAFISNLNCCNTHICFTFYCF